MKRRQKYRSPDGLDWRDPNMPLVRNYTFANGRQINTIDPVFEQSWRQRCMEINTSPEWRDDPTYHPVKRRHN